MIGVNYTGKVFIKFIMIIIIIITTYIQYLLERRITIISIKVACKLKK